MADSTDVTGATEREQCAYPWGERHGLDPNPLFEQLRRDQPMFRIQLPYGPPGWLVTGYRLAKGMLTDPRFSRAATLDRDVPRYVPVDISQVPENILNMDPPKHTQVRQVVGRALTARRVEELRPRIQRIASGLINGMKAAGPPADLVECFSFALPSLVICELVGVEPDDRHMFRRWANEAVSTAAVSLEQRQETYLYIAAYLAEEFEKRRSQPRDDLLTWLVEARGTDDGLTDSGLVFLASAVLLGGYETTGNQISNMVYTLLNHPEQLAELRSQPELLPTAVEELLRFIRFGNPVNPRIATADVQLGDVLVRAGEPVMMSCSSANHDQSIFENPEELDITRNPNPHVAFGHGPHHCLGAQLARVELQVSLEAILFRLPGLRIAVPDTDLVWQNAALTSGLTAFPVTWDAG